MTKKIKKYSKEFKQTAVGSLLIVEASTSF